MRKENLVVTCSGGETSMTVTLYCLKHLQDKYNILVIYANTGVESDKTLDFLHKCEVEFNIPIHWIEAKVYHNKRKSCGYYKVDYSTATRNTDWKNRNDTPFEEVIKKYGLPNHSRLHCTRELKMNPIKAYAKDYFTELSFQGWCIEHGREGFIKSIFDGTYKLTTASKTFEKDIIDDHLETESCEIFSNCGEQ